MLAICALAVGPLYAAGPAKSQKMEIMEGKLSLVEGTVEVRKMGSNDWVQATPGMVIRPGDAVSAGIDGKAKIAYENSVTDVAPLAQFVIGRAVETEHEYANEIILQVGKIKCDVDHVGSKTNKFNITTPSAACGIRGTIVEASYTAELGPQITTEEGLVATYPVDPTTLPPAVQMVLGVGPAAEAAAAGAEGAAPVAGGAAPGAEVAVGAPVADAASDVAAAGPAAGSSEATVSALAEWIGGFEADVTASNEAVAAEEAAAPAEAGAADVAAPGAEVAAPGAEAPALAEDPLIGGGAFPELSAGGGEDVVMVGEGEAVQFAPAEAGGDVAPAFEAPIVGDAGGLAELAIAAEATPEVAALVVEDEASKTLTDAQLDVLIENVIEANPGEIAGNAALMMELLNDPSHSDMTDLLMSQEADLVGALATQYSSVMSAFINQDPGSFQDLMEQRPEVFQDMISNDPTLGAEFIAENSALMSEMLMANSEYAAQLVEGNPDLFQDMSSASPAFFNDMLAENPALIESYMSDNPALMAEISNDQPELFTTLMANPDFSSEASDMFTLMMSDPAYQDNIASFIDANSATFTTLLSDPTFQASFEEFMTANPDDFSSMVEAEGSLMTILLADGDFSTEMTTFIDDNSTLFTDMMTTDPALFEAMMTTNPELLTAAGYDPTVLAATDPTLAVSYIEGLLAGTPTNTEIDAAADFFITSVLGAMPTTTDYMEAAAILNGMIVGGNSAAALSVTEAVITDLLGATPMPADFDEAAAFLDGLIDGGNMSVAVTVADNISLDLLGAMPATTDYNEAADFLDGLIDDGNMMVAMSVTDNTVNQLLGAAPTTSDIQEAANYIKAVDDDQVGSYQYFLDLVADHPAQEAALTAELAGRDLDDDYHLIAVSPSGFAQESLPQDLSPHIHTQGMDYDGDGKTIDMADPDATIDPVNHETVANDHATGM